MPPSARRFPGHTYSTRHLIVGMLISAVAIEVTLQRASG